MIKHSNYIFISCGEASGDLYASRLASELIKIDPNLIIKCIGGDLLKNTGAVLLKHINELQFIGTFEIIPKVFHILSILSKLKKQLKQEPPLLAILVDFPDFNFILGKFLKKINVPIIYYISPQIWAWRYYRIYTMKQFVDLVIPLFKFEEKIYQQVGIQTYFIGHPLLDIIITRYSKKDFLNKYNLNKDSFLLGIMPGSRLQELKYHTKTLVEVLKKIKNQMPSISLIVIKAPTIPLNSLNAYKQIGAIIIEQDKYEAMHYCDLLLIASGTATIEACIAETPMIVFYKLNSISWGLGRWLVKTKFLSMVNICAGEEIVPEYYQTLFTINNLFDITMKMIKSPNLLLDQKLKLQKLKYVLGNKNSTVAIAQYIFFNYLKNN